MQDKEELRCTLEKDYLALHFCALLGSCHHCSFSHCQSFHFVTKCKFWHLRTWYSSSSVPRSLSITFLHQMTQGQLTHARCDHIPPETLLAPLHPKRISPWGGRTSRLICFATHFHGGLTTTACFRQCHLCSTCGSCSNQRNKAAVLLTSNWNLCLSLVPQWHWAARTLFPWRIFT